MINVRIHQILQHAYESQLGKIIIIITETDCVFYLASYLIGGCVKPEKVGMNDNDIVVLYSVACYHVNFFLSTYSVYS